jgi:alcohol dehydrogenase (cytochrome c)
VKPIAGLPMAAGVTFLSVAALVAQGPADRFAPVTQNELYNPVAADWLMLGGNMEHWNYSRLDQINRENVRYLQLVWARQMPTTGGRAGTSPLIHNGVMYLVSPNDVILALDAKSGNRIWEYRRSLPQIGTEPGMIHHRYSGAKRGLALYGDKIFTVTSDNAVVALDSRTGKVAWETSRGTDGYVANTSGPIIADGILIAGGSCQNAAFGCYVTGHDIANGKELWRNEVIPHPDGPGDETWRGMPFENRWCTGVWGQIVRAAPVRRQTCSAVSPVRMRPWLGRTPALPCARPRAKLYGVANFCRRITGTRNVLSK